MSKTYQDQIDKARALVSGVRKNYEKIKDKGITLEELAALEANLDDGARLNAEVDALREQTSAKVRQANGKLADIKDVAQRIKRTVKQNYDPTEWADFGVPDKR